MFREQWGGLGGLSRLMVSRFARGLKIVEHPVRNALVCLKTFVAII